MDYSQQQQNDYIDREAQKIKDDADRQAALDKQAVADKESDRITQEAADKVRQIQYDAQK
jgi:hypothetical protein